MKIKFMNSSFFFFFFKYYSVYTSQVFFFSFLKTNNIAKNKTNKVGSELTNWLLNLKKSLTSRSECKQHKTVSYALKIFISTYSLPIKWFASCCSYSTKYYLIYNCQGHSTAIWVSVVKISPVLQAHYCFVLKN